MRKFLLLPVFCLTVLATSCSSDDSVQMNEDYSNFTTKAVQCTNIADLEHGAVLLGNNILFYWNKGNLLRIVGRTYTSKLEIKNRGCTGSTSITSYTIDLLNSETYTLNGGVPAPTFPAGGTDNCFQYRYTVTSYDGLNQFCYTESEWFDFPN